jgi:hypothetical protein
MPKDKKERWTDERALRAAHQDAKEGKSPTTQAGEFVREEIHHVREGRHGARSTKQAIAIGLSKARRAGVPLPPPPPGRVSKSSRESAESAYEAGRKHPTKRASPTRSRATERALRREGRSAASPAALARQARSAARRRGPAARSAAARKAARTRRGT